MKLTISHQTDYHYDEPVKFSLQRLRLTPLTGPGQQVISWDVSVEGAQPQVSYTDQFGNCVTLVSLEGERQDTRIRAEGVIETEDLHGVIGAHTGFAPLWLFLRETVLTKPGRLVRDLARSVSGENELARMHALMTAIHETVRYEPGSSDIETPAEQALDAKTGVCQDHAHIFIAAARTLKIPTRYVSGYLLMDAEAQGASHAWAEAHVPGLGWIGFDPANNICPDERYVRLATGLSYRDAAPVSGMRIGKPGETMTVNLEVKGPSQSQDGQSQSQDRQSQSGDGQSQSGDGQSQSGDGQSQN